ncbi:MAG: hypothetical protein LBT59_11585 [Clostridiales bacterium]|jgi:hypothetical protein|nr:hypothetical protein [Clostridiales bacterium]
MQQTKMSGLFANAIWQADSEFVPLSSSNGDDAQAQIVLVQDHKSRAILGHGCFHVDSAVNTGRSLKDIAGNTQAVVKKAILEHGKPGVLRMDKESLHSTSRLMHAFALIDVALIPFKPRELHAKGNLERLMRAIDDSCLKGATFSLEKLSEMLEEFVNLYNNRYLDSIGMTPLESWRADCDAISFVDKNELDKAFMHLDHSGACAE